MALSDLFGFFSKDATEKYNAKPHDPAKARKPLLDGITKARDSFNADEFTKANRWFSVKNKHVEFHPKLHGRRLILNGVEKNHMPSDRFVEFLDLMEKEVRAGEFDQVIADHGKGNVDVHIGKEPSATSGGSGRVITPEGRVQIAMNNRFNKSFSDKDLEAKLIQKGHDAEIVRAAIKNRKKA